MLALSLALPGIIVAILVILLIIYFGAARVSVPLRLNS
jgi:hypothetical protein